MKSILQIISLLLLLFAGFIFYIFLTTGFFRNVKNAFDGDVIREIPLEGAEDMTISYPDSFLLISATDRQKPHDGIESGHLYMMDLRNIFSDPVKLTTSFHKPFSPHGISMIKADSVYKIMAISHPGKAHTIEEFTLNGMVLTHDKTLRDPAMISPNDLVMVSADQFYFTNDHRHNRGPNRFLEDFGGRAVSNVVYFDGSDYREVADGIAYANGINFDRERQFLYVASSRGFLIKVYRVKADGNLAFIEDIPCGTGVDNIELDAHGHIWVAAHPNLLRFRSYAKGKRDTAPSEILRINYRGKNDYSIDVIYTGTGELISASSVASSFGKHIFVGTVMDNEMVVLKTE